MELSRRNLLSAALASGARGLPARAAEQTSPVWDVHCHLISVPGNTPGERMAELVKYMDRLGIHRVVLSLTAPLMQNPTPAQFQETNDRIIQALRSAPDRAFGFAYLSPDFPEESVREFDRCVRDGPMVGVKLWVARHCNVPEVDPIIERAVSMQVPVLQHTWWKTGGNLPGESIPPDIAELAARHPKAMLIAAHTGGDWERGIRAVRASRNVSVDVSGFNPTAGVVEMAVRELGAERVLLGTDAVGRSFASQLGKVTGAEISEADRRLVLGGNLRRMLSPILKRKGYRT